MRGLIDSHCHLMDDAFESDLERVLISAQAAGIEKIIVPAVDLTSSIKSVELAQKYPQLYAAVGVHPEKAASFLDADLKELERLANHEKVVAIGEIGLDFHYPPFNADLQRRIFSQMLELSAIVNKPVLVHSRDAIVNVLESLKYWVQVLQHKGNASLLLKPGILHAFEGDLSQANQAVEMNFAIGLGGPLTYKNSQEKISIAGQLNLSHLVLETDSPYLPPHPYRGQRNEPAYLQQIALKLAEIKGLPVDEIAYETGATCKRILNLDKQRELID